MNEHGDQLQPDCGIFSSLLLSAFSNNYLLVLYANAVVYMMIRSFFHITFQPNIARGAYKYSNILASATHSKILAISIIFQKSRVHRILVHYFL
jgi:hypothetical protein